MRQRRAICSLPQRPQRLQRKRIMTSMVAGVALGQTSDDAAHLALEVGQHRGRLGDEAPVAQPGAPGLAHVWQQPQLVPQLQEGGEVDVEPHVVL